MLPFLVQFLKELETDEDGLVYVNKFKNVLREEMITRCAKNLNIKLLAKSSFFDKRYSNKLKFLSRICHLLDLDVQVTSDQIISEIKEELNLLNIISEENSNSLEEEQPRKKKKVFWPNWR